MINKKLCLKYIFAFFYFSINYFVLIFLYSKSGNFWLELYKYSQFFAFILLVILLFGKLKILKFLTVASIFFLYYLMIIFHFITNSKVDFLFIERNFADIGIIINLFLSYFLLAIAVSLINSFFTVILIPKIQSKIYASALMVFLAMFISVPFLKNNESSENEFIAFAKNIVYKDNTVDYYQNNYSNLIKQSEASRGDILKRTGQIKEIHPYLRNIIVIQLESINSYLVNEQTTPNFFALAKTGIFFPKIYSNSVETILAQENILCSLPGSFDLSLTDKELDKKILCLPEILQSLGYKNIFLKTYDLNFTRTGQFMKNIGFNEVRADDIMNHNDPQYPWGYREDVFFKRAFNYIETEKNAEKNFIYLEIGPTNHWPFQTPAEYANSVPFKNPSNHRERLINTTFLQDTYLKNAWEEINRLFPKKNRTVIILGDHSWPAEFHPGNTINQKNAFEENFSTAMAVFIGEEKGGKIITAAHSLMDVTPSILDLFGIELPKNNFRNSFINEIKGGSSSPAAIITIQPYDKYINILKDNLKYQYSGLTKNFTVFDLNADPNEAEGKPLESDPVFIIKNLLK